MKTATLHVPLKRCNLHCSRRMQWQDGKGYRNMHCLHSEHYSSAWRRLGSMLHHILRMDGGNQRVLNAWSHIICESVGYSRSVWAATHSRRRPECQFATSIQVFLFCRRCNPARDGLPCSLSTGDLRFTNIWAKPILANALI